MTVLIPNKDKKFLQTNRSDTLGNLWSTWNIDLQDNVGAIRLGHRLKLLGKTGDTNLTNLSDAPSDITMFKNSVYFIAGSRIFRSTYSGDNDGPNMTFVEDNSTGKRTDWGSLYDSLCTFNGTLCATNSIQSKLYSLNAIDGTWTDRGVVSGSAGTRLLYFKKYDRLYVLDYANSAINSVNTSWGVSTTAGSYSITLTKNDDGGNLQCFAPASDRIWIGTRRGVSGSASDNTNPNTWCSVYDWDGLSAQVTKEYKIPAQGVMSIVMRNDIPIVMDTNGVLREFNGQGFAEIGRLPLLRGQQLLTTAQPQWTANFIHPDGLAVTKDNTILAAINGLVLTGYVSNNASTRMNYENLPSGIWEFDGKGSASHKQSFSLMPSGSTSVSDHGQNIIDQIGSLGYIRIPTSSAYGISEFFTGASFYVDASNTKTGIFVAAPDPATTATYPEGQKYGYIVTSWLESPIDMRNPAAQEMWQQIWATFKLFNDSSDKIWLKYRTSKQTPTQTDITWTSTTTFTTSTDLSGKVGYEVEVLRGTGGGKCAHITSAPYVGGTCTVTLDEAFTGATGTATVRVQNWVLTDSWTNMNVDLAHLHVMKAASRIQFKLCMQFTGDDEVYQLAVVSRVQQPLN